VAAAAFWKTAGSSITPELVDAVMAAAASKWIAGSNEATVKDALVAVPVAVA
jgi:hypothetical protein